MCLEQYLTNSKENPKHCFGTSTEWEWIWKRIIIKECSCHPSYTFIHHDSNNSFGFDKNAVPDSMLMKPKILWTRI